MSGSGHSGADAPPIAECRLDLGGLRDQRERYRSLGRQVAAIDRHEGGLEITFGPELDVRLLDETISVERECCPFFRLRYDSGRRRLYASVEHPEQEPALEAIAHALTR